jgi:hypothetical protein
VRRARRAMHGGLLAGAGGALHGARIVCDTMRCARAGCIRAVRCDARDAMRGSVRCAARCEDCLRCNALRTGWLHLRGALRCTGCDAWVGALRCTGCDAMRCARSGCSCRCRRRHAFDHGFLKTKGFIEPQGSRWVGGFKEWVDGWAEEWVDGWV